MFQSLLWEKGCVRREGKEIGAANFTDLGQLVVPASIIALSLSLSSPKTTFSMARPLLASRFIPVVSLGEVKNEKRVPNHRSIERNKTKSR